MESKNYKDYNDYELIYQVREKDEYAYGILYEKYHPIISKLAKFYYNYNQGVGLEVADLYQEGMYGLERALNDYDEKVSLFYTYALLCIRREMERIVKGSRRYKHSTLNDAYSFHNHICGNQDLYIEDTLYNENTLTERLCFSDYYSELLERYKYELPDKEAQIFELKINGFNNNEISKLLDINKKSIDGYIRKIRRLLQKYKNKIEH